MDAIKKQVIQNVAKRYRAIDYKERKQCVWCGDKAIDDYYKKLDAKTRTHESQR